MEVYLHWGQEKPLAMPSTPKKLNRPAGTNAKTKTHIVTARLGSEDYRAVLAAAKSSHQTVTEWIESMCHTATRD